MPDDRSNILEVSLRQIGDTRTAAILRGIVELFDMVFPDRVRGYYLLGSVGERTAVELSDIDLIVLFADSFADNEETMARRVAAACGLLSPIRLDIVLQSEATVRVEDVRLKLGTYLLAGEDVRDQLPLPMPEVHARYITDWTTWFIRRLHDNPPLNVPLRYPDGADPFYGYARVRIPAWYPPDTTRGTKEFVTTVCWTATALLSLMLGEDGYVGTKGEAVRRYRDADEGVWGSYVAEVYAYGKGAWRYGVPEDAPAREHLRSLCEHGLPFFNHYLERYQSYLRQQSRIGDATARQWEQERLSELPPM